MKKGSFLCLLIGMWTMTQINVIGFLGISELVIYLIAPWVYVKNVALLRRDKMSTLMNLLFLTMLSCLVSGWWNQNGMIETLKGFATIYGFWACIVVLYPMLRKNPDDLKWLLLGFAISGVISIFIFQPGSAYVGAINDRLSLQESVMGYALFWTNQINTWAQLPIKMSYLSIPVAYSICVPAAMSFYALISTASGRSAFLVGMFGVVLMCLGGKSYRALSRIRKNFTLIAVVILIGGLVFAYAYKFSAKTGLLGEAAQTKYETQVESKGRGEGLLAMIMGGRLEFFIGATACLQHPLLGCGPKAEDKEGLINYFFEKYGTYEDLESLAMQEQMRIAKGQLYRNIPAHSHIIVFWLWYGIVGAILWTYILCVMLKTLKNYMTAIPQWFGYFALILPSATWAVFFSPFGDRVQKAVLVCACFIVKNVFEGRIQLPSKMIKDILKHSK